MKTLNELEQEKLKLNEELDNIHEQIDAKKACTLVQCVSNRCGVGCGMGFEIKELDYIQTHWYTQPHGWTGGDYWNIGEGNFMCPKCGHRNRLYDKPEIEELKSLFKSKINEYKHL